MYGYYVILLGNCLIKMYHHTNSAHSLIYEVNSDSRVKQKLKAGECTRPAQYMPLKRKFESRRNLISQIRLRNEFDEQKYCRQRKQNLLHKTKLLFVNVETIISDL